MTTQIRIGKTTHLEKALAALKERFCCLSESEIIKLAVSHLYQKEFKAVGESGLSDQDQKALDETLRHPELAGPFSSAKGMIQSLKS